MIPCRIPKVGSDMFLNMSETTASDRQLLDRYTSRHAEDAFAEIVRRHLALVHSAALRQVRSPQLAEEVAQSVFTDLARQAQRLAPDTVLTAWLYQVTRRTAIDVVRREASRQLREQIATEMNAMNATAADWTYIEPLLDDALHALDETDRTAVLLRYFESKSLREVGTALGTSDDAAQKRVSRAVERLREFFAQHGVTVGASGLVVALSAHAVQAAPVGLAATISATALSGTAVSVSNLIVATKTIAMTTLQKMIVAATLAVAVSGFLYERRQVADLREQNQSLQRQQVSLGEQIQELQHAGDIASNRLVTATDDLAEAKRSPSEVLKLRGQVGVLRQEKADLGSKSVLSKMTADPESRNLIRSQQKMGMSAIYTDLAKRLKLTPEATGQFNDLLADHVMDKIDLTTQVLHDKNSRSEIDRLFSSQDAAFHQKLSALVGPDGLTQYSEYSKDLISTLTAAGFEQNLTGDKEAKAAKKQQLAQAVQEEARTVLAAAGLPADYQALPMLNFRNIVFEDYAEQSLKILDSIIERVAARADTFLNADELKKLQEARTKALENNRTLLQMNRKMMAPISP